MLQTRLYIPRHEFARFYARIIADHEYFRSRVLIHSLFISSSVRLLPIVLALSPSTPQGSFVISLEMVHGPIVSMHEIPLGVTNCTVECPFFYSHAFYGVRELTSLKICFRAECECITLAGNIFTHPICRDLLQSCDRAYMLKYYDFYIHDSVFFFLY